jgi:cell division protease FtsH
MINRRELEVTAYHEAGHAVVCHLIEDFEPVHKVTIIPRGRAGGLTSFLPEQDHVLRSRRYYQADMAVSLGGRAAEEVVLGDISTGASSDLEHVTRMARDMVTRYGMSESLGPITFGQKHELIFLGRELSEQRNYSEAMARQIDQEVRRLVNDAYDRARGLIVDNIDRVHAVASRLLEVETLDRQEFEQVMALATVPVSA